MKVRAAALAVLGALGSAPSARAADPLTDAFAAADGASTPPARGACRRDGLQLFPIPGAVLPLNAQLLLEGFGRAQAVVSALAGGTVALEADGDLLPVKVESGWVSARGRVAVVMKPLRPLQPRTRYALRLTPELTPFLESGRPLAWQSGAAADKRAPEVTSPPRVVEGLYRQTPQGPARYLKVRASLVDDSPVYWLVTLRRARGGVPSQTYVVPLDGGVGWLGHDGCSGSFTFDEGRAYRGVFTAIDAAGHASPPTRELEFQAPRKEAQQ